MPYLRIRNGPNQGKVFEIKDDVITIGRDENQTIQILDQGVSRMHAEIFKLGGVVFVRDLNSTNGTYVNTVRITEEALKENDELLIGRTVLRYEEKLHPAPDVTPSEPVPALARPDAPVPAAAPTRRVSAPVALEIRTRSLTLTHELGRILLSSEHLDEALRKAVQLVAESIGADDGYLFMSERSTGRLIPRASFERQEDASERKVSKTIAKRILQTGVPMLTADATLDERLNISESVVLRKIRSVIAVPVHLRERAEGLLYFHTARTSSPFSSDDLEVVTAAALQLSIALTHHIQTRHLRGTLISTVRALVHAMEERHPKRRGHSDRVAQYSSAIARQLGLSRDDIDRIHLAGLLHDVGRMNEPADGGEEQPPEAHVHAGERIVSAIEGYEEILPGVRYHHERADGSGYPYRIRNEETPLMARIVIVANEFDNLGMSGGGSGRDPGGRESLVQVSEGGGKLFDEDVVKALLVCHHSGALFEQPVEV